MEHTAAVSALSALAQTNRLEIFRLLVRAGSNGLAAGEIAKACDLSATRTSFHMKELERSGLVFARRDGRFIRYAIAIDSVRDFLTFLTEECCEGNPDMCGNAFASALVCGADENV